MYRVYNLADAKYVKFSSSYKEESVSLAAHYSKYKLSLKRMKMVGADTSAL